MTPTLIVIDMQPAFRDAFPQPVVQAVAEEIERTKQAKGAVIFVEYANSGSTVKELTSLVRNYPMRAKVKKWENDGSLPLLDFFSENKHFGYRHLRVCGVNADACVRETVRGLLCRLPTSRVEVVQRACGQDYAPPSFSWIVSPQRWFRSMPQLCLA